MSQKLVILIKVYLFLNITFWLFSIIIAWIISNLYAEPLRDFFSSSFDGPFYKQLLGVVLLLMVYTFLFAIITYFMRILIDKVVRIFRPDVYKRLRFVLTSFWIKTFLSVYLLCAALTFGLFFLIGGYPG